MAQVTIYLPDELLERARRKAKSAESSLSAWLAELVRHETERVDWPAGFVELLTTGRGDLVVPDDPPPEDVEALS